MTMKQNTDRISIQVGLSGYSFKIESDADIRSSEWLSSDRVFTTAEFQRRYDEVEIAVYTPKFTLVPSQFFAPDSFRRQLEDVVCIRDNETVEYIELPEHAAVLLYSNTIGETLSKVISETVLRTDGTKIRPLPAVYDMLCHVMHLPDYNKVLASYVDGVLYLVIAQGKTLLLCNSFKAPDFTTAQYFIFMAMKRLQLNPEISAITMMNRLAEEEEMSLYRYFKSVELI